MADGIPVAALVPPRESLRRETPQHVLRRHRMGQAGFLVQNQPPIEQGGFAEHGLRIGRAGFAYRLEQGERVCPAGAPAFDQATGEEAAQMLVGARHAIYTQ